jgi:hypothetical protein
MICDEEHKTLSSSLCNLLQAPVIFSLASPNIFFSTQIYMIHLTTKFHTHRKKNNKITVLHILILMLFKHQPGRENILKSVEGSSTRMKHALNSFKKTILIYLNFTT